MPETTPLSQQVSKYVRSIAGTTHAHLYPPCNAGSLFHIQAETGSVLVVPLRCKSWRCIPCARRLSRHWALRIAREKPTLFLTLTASSRRYSDPRAMYDRMKTAWLDLVIMMRQEFGRVETCAIWEAHKSGYPHLHVTIRWKFIPITWIRYWWERFTGGRQVRIDKVKSEKGTAFYCASYMMKTAYDQGRTFRPERMILHTRGFFTHKDEPPEAEKRPPLQWTWTRMHIGEIARVLSAEMKAWESPADDASLFLFEDHHGLPFTPKHAIKLDARLRRSC